MSPGDTRRALRKARRLGASLVPNEYREGWRLEAQIVKAAQRRESWRGGCWALAGGRYRAEYLDAMGEARRAGDVERWRMVRAWLDIWRGAHPFAPGS